MDFYQIVESTDYTNGCFDLKILWNVQSIVRSGSSGNGYIVQKIDRELSATKSFEEQIRNEMDQFRHSYFEAWKVKDFHVVLPEDYGFHDEWKYSRISFWDTLDDYKLKMQTKGTLKMTGTVYWIEEETEAVKTVKDTFKVGLVKWANKLLSSYCFQEANTIEPVLIRRKIGEWDFISDSDFTNALLEYVVPRSDSLEDLLNALETRFQDTPIWSDIIIKAPNIYR